jgi:hypothetical protein
LFSWLNDAANNINIRADRMDQEMDGFASGLSNCITRDGQGKPSAAIDWNGQNLSNVNALTATSGAFTGAVSGSTGTFTGAVSGASGAFTGAMTAASAAVTGAVTGATATFSGLAHALTPTTGDRSTSLATTQMFSDEFVKSLSGNGYQKLPSGLIIQWGPNTTPAGGALAFGFNIAFPTACLSASANVISAGAGTYSANVSAYTVSQMTVVATNNNAGIAASFNWLAIGY